MTFARNTTAPSGLPTPDGDSAQHLREMHDYLVQRLQQTPKGFMPFDEWMQHALYAPGLGYYVAGNTKFGSDLPEGDFTTAPELTPLFGQALAGQVAQILAASGSKTILEVGAGTGALAAALIPALNLLGIRPKYQILEVSGDLRERQRQTLSGAQANIQWLDNLPERFKGCIIANEVLDAMPATMFAWDEQGQLQELGVKLDETSPPSQASSVEAAPNFVLAQRPASEALESVVSQRMPALPGYQSEINLQAEAWMRQMGSWLAKGAALIIDYGFPQREFYHPQRAEGTLMCHFRHHAHADPLLYPGIQDITTHIDFTAMADAALEGDLEILGYTSQARFLMNAGLIELLTGLDPHDAADYAKAVGPVQKLLSEAEMGELFKVMAVGRDIDVPLMGFSSGDRRGRL